MNPPTQNVQHAAWQGVIDRYAEYLPVNDSTPVGNAAFSPDELKQWAPPLTPEFMS